jgi:hypothetical protein
MDPGPLPYQKIKRDKDKKRFSVSVAIQIK